jgi:hypothetical protein
MSAGTWYGREEGAEEMRDEARFIVKLGFVIIVFVHKRSFARRVLSEFSPLVER